MDLAIERIANLVPPGSLGVYGVPRGGLCLAVSLSHRLNLPLLLQPAPGMLCVDDIADSGSTMWRLMMEFPGSIFAVWVKRQTADLDLYHATVEPSKDWILFPWEHLGRAYADEKQYLNESPASRDEVFKTIGAQGFA